MGLAAAGKRRLFTAHATSRLMQCSKRLAYSMGLGASAILGSRIVKVEPRPGSLSIGECRAHHLAEAFTDREAQAGATVLARRGGRSLGKLLEQLAHLLRGHADASIGDRKRDPGRGRAPVLGEWRW